MAGIASGRSNLRRLRATHRRMSFAAFTRLPRQLGWKYEYYNGQAHITPYPTVVTLRLALAPRLTFRRNGIRPVTRADADRLSAPFLAAFAQAPEYVSFSSAQYREAAVTYLEGFFGSVRGTWSSASLMAELEGEVVAAALVKERRSGPLLDCVFVRPDCARRGWATALVGEVVNALIEAGERQLLSYVLLANASSLAWHTRFGFREIPDLFVALRRAGYYQDEQELHRAVGDLSAPEWERLNETANHWSAEADRLTRLACRNARAAHPRFT